MTGRFGELLLIVLIVFVLFGAGKLPKVIGELGRGMRMLRDSISGSDKGDIEDSQK